MHHSFCFQKLRFHRFTPYVLLIMDAPSSAAAAPSEILDLAAVPRPMQQRVHIVVQVALVSDCWEISSSSRRGNRHPWPDGCRDDHGRGVKLLYWHDQASDYKLPLGPVPPEPPKKGILPQVSPPSYSRTCFLELGWHMAWNASLTKYPIQRRASPNSIVSQLGFYLPTPTGG